MKSKNALESTYNVHRCIVQSTATPNALNCWPQPPEQPYFSLELQRPWVQPSISPHCSQLAYQTHQGHSYGVLWSHFWGLVCAPEESIVEMNIRIGNGWCWSHVSHCLFWWIFCGACDQTHVCQSQRWQWCYQCYQLNHVCHGCHHLEYKVPQLMNNNWIRWPELRMHLN